MCNATFISLNSHLILFDILRNIHLSDILNAFSTVSPNDGARLACNRFCTFLLNVVCEQIKNFFSEHHVNLIPSVVNIRP